MIPIVVNAIDTADTGYIVETGEKKEIDAHGVCKVVDNETDEHGNPINIFVPTKTVAEWEAFRNNLPQHVFLLPCVTVVVPPAATPTNSSGPDIYFHYYKDGGSGSFWN